MQNHPNRADGGAMSVTRRSALRSLFAGTLAASTGVAIAAATPAEAAPIADDAEIFALERQYRTAHRAHLRAIKAEEAVCATYRTQRAAKPIMPSHSLSGDDLLRATLAEIRDRTGLAQEPKEHKEAYARWKVEHAAWTEADAKLRKRLGMEKANLAVCRCVDKADRIAKKLMRTRARTPAGMLAKIRVQVKADFQDGILERELAKDLRATMRAASAPTGGRA